MRNCLHYMYIELKNMTALWVQIYTLWEWQNMQVVEIIEDDGNQEMNHIKW